MQIVSSGRKQFAGNVKAYFLAKIRKIISMSSAENFTLHAKCYAHALYHRDVFSHASEWKGRQATCTTWAAPCENVSLGICGQRRPRSACTSTQSDQGLHCLLTESYDTTECMNGEQRLGWYFEHVQESRNLHICACWKALFHLMWPTWSLDHSYIRRRTAEVYHQYLTIFHSSLTLLLALSHLTTKWSRWAIVRHNFS